MGSIIISVAHSDIDHGAEIADSNINEFDVSDRQSTIIAEILAAKGHCVDLFSCSGMTFFDYREEKLRRINESGPWGLCLEIHHNSDKHDSQYGCVIHYSDSKKGKKAASSISKELEKVMPWEVRGAKSHLLFEPPRMWFIKMTDSPALIVEPGFFSHKDSFEHYRSFDLFDKEAAATAQGIDNYFKSIDKVISW